jgi:nucleoside-diphosphate-sugar epimerase
MPNDAFHKGAGQLTESGTYCPPDGGRFVVNPDERILITGAAGFIGSRVVGVLLRYGFRNLVCFARPSSELAQLEANVSQRVAGARIEVIRGNLLSREDCEVATKDVAVILHLAAGTGEKSFPNAFLNSVVATRNLLDASLRNARLKRLVLVSSFSVYSNRGKRKPGLLDESCPVEDRPALSGEAYCYAKVKQEELVVEYGKSFALPYVIVRPGSVYGPRKSEIVGRVGVGTFGVFLHLGGSNRVPLTHVENCAEAIVLAGIVGGITGEAFNIVDDGLPTSRSFLRQYKSTVRPFKSLYIPHFASYALCYMWEKYSQWSRGQIPSVFNRRRWRAYWKQTRYSNEKLKARLGWRPRVPTSEGLRAHFQACAESERHA